MNECNKTNCFAPDALCQMGNPKLSDCEFWQNSSHQDDNENAIADDSILLPWTGDALGLNDLEFISGSSRPIVIGIVGAENSGKTTLLASWFLLVSKGLINGIKLRFAGSYSLLGWEHVSSNLKWETGQPPTFPPHTPSQSRRSPGLLHLTFYNEKDGLTQDYLFTDAPGEWFQKWAINSESKDAEGARWLSNNADIFLLIADTEAFSTKGKGRARSRFQSLSNRLSGELNNRPVALVWSKSDFPADQDMINNVRDSTLRTIENAEEFRIQVVPNSNDSESTNVKELLKLLEWITNTKAGYVELPQYRYTGSDPFFMSNRGI